ncbi:GDSL esterase/lipase At1g06990 isoform X2 [Jatropha curcas]|uniref:GDSL esterase/lipase At1g06990 isoform X2 n=1 Tax=Jatropha curcas TaxID=180498 RepID=UPI0009D6DC33|nr:GDSL esterase/lipase At1g06990 isoform X2 [Jatropha curcas]
MAVTSFFLSTFLAITLSICNFSKATTFPRASAILVFGDSTVDTGNNKYIQTPFRTDHFPYGQDFPGHIPTGRCSNGKLIPDFLGSFLGIKETIPPFLDPNLSNQDILTGVCFASAGSGYDYLTTSVSGVIPMSKQLEFFNDYIARLKSIVGEEEGNKIIGSSLIIVSAGTNDFVYNFYDIPARSLQFNISSYQDFLLSILHDFVKELYNLGGRLMVIAGIPPIGCLPIQITERMSKNSMERTCLEDENSDSKAYNMKLKQLLNQMQASIPQSRIGFHGNEQRMLRDGASGSSSLMQRRNSNMWNC